MNELYEFKPHAGFYVIASDKDLLAKVTGLLQHKGYFGVVDTSGKVNYLVDGRRNAYRAAHQISELVSVFREDETDVYRSADRVREVSEQILSSFEIPENLKGYLYLRKIMALLAEDPTRLKPASKYLYPETAKYFKVAAGQVDRVIRYATKQAGITLSNGQFLTLLNEKLQQGLKNYKEEK